MTDIKRPINKHKAYHAHIYFEQETLEFASNLCAQAGERFALKVGTVHRRLVGPHPKWSCQITFGTRDFEQFIPWLDENRKGLSVLVHALTGDDLLDHTDYAYWLGEPLSLKLSVFDA